MGLNKARGDMYEFITHTWNPIGGTCPHGCSYCYMKKIRGRFRLPDKEPFLKERELEANLGSGNFIFVGSSTDIFAYGIRGSWRGAVVAHTVRHPGNQYLWHTKNPMRAGQDIPETENNILCVTIESDKVPPEIRGDAGDIYGRVISMEDFKGRKMVSIEPIMDFRMDNLVVEMRAIRPEQVNIGADTGHNHLPEPPPGKVRELIAELGRFTKVHLKRNLGRLMEA